MSEFFIPLLLAIPILGGMVFLFRKWRNRKRTRKLAAPGIELAAVGEASTFSPSFVEAIIELGKSYGYKRKKSQTLGEFVEQLRGDGIGSKDLFDAVDYIYQVRYVGGKRNLSMEKGFRKNIRRLISAPG